MKKFYSLSMLLTLTGLLTLGQQAQAQFDFSMGYSHARPGGLMQRYIDGSHGLVLEGLYRLPNTRLSVGLQLNMSVYGSQERQDIYVFDSGAEQEVDVNVSNNFILSSAVLRYALTNSNTIIPYVTSRIGLATFWTDLTIEERNSGGGHGDCPEPIESDVLLSDTNLQYSFGAGIQADISKVFDRLPQGRWYMDIQATYLRGGSVRYMSVDAPVQNTTNRTRMPDSDPVTLPFVSNMEPDIVHQYHVGTSYRTELEMINFQIGFVHRW